MAEIDRRARDEYGISTRELMENAGGELASVILENDNIENILVLCGPGNNGGDGLAAARKLAENDKQVTVLLSVSPSALKEEPLFQYRLATESGIKIFSPEDKGYALVKQQIEEFDCVVDALLGIGVHSPPKGEILELINSTRQGRFIVSADIPTGIHPDTGMSLGNHVNANRTVTFGLPKPFLFQNDGLIASGQYTIADIGFPWELVENAGHAFLLTPLWLIEHLHIRPVAAHKRSAGVVLVIAGAEEFPGAAALTAMGAYRAGAGLVVVASIPTVLNAVTMHLPECPLVPLSSEEGCISPDSLSRLLEAVSRCNAVAIGPGLSRKTPAKEFLSLFFAKLDKPCVLDADALYFLPEISEMPRVKAVLTPHEGEAARLMKTDASEIRKDRFESVRELAKKYQTTVLLKGPYTLITAPNQDVAVNPMGNQLLATGGTGDVLTGMIATNLAIGMEPYDAAALAAYLHGFVADLLAEDFEGYQGALASEIANAIPKARKQFMEILAEQFRNGDEEEDEDDEDVRLERFEESEN